LADLAIGRHGRAPAHAAEAEHTGILRYLAPFVWPAGRPDLKARVVGAVVLLVIAKLVTVAMPLAYKAAVDALTSTPHAAGGGAALPFADTAVIVLALIVAYGAARVMMMGFNQLRDVLFTHIGQNATRVLANRTFQHIHELSLRFHLERRTGGLSRVLERGKNAIELIIRMGMLSLIPTILEVLFVCILFQVYFGWTFVLIVLAMISAYVWFSFVASEWRMAIRRELNDSDVEANTKSVDSLLNYETVKYFGNERWESDRYDRSMARYERASIRTYSSLAWLNLGQTLIFTLGMTLCMLLAARGVMNGAMSVGDFVLVNAVFIQLYQPLNFMGMIYRDLKQGLVDIEAMFALIGQEPEVIDKPGAQPLRVTKGEIRFEDVTFAYDEARPILRGVSFEVPAGKMVALVGPSGAGKSTISRLLYRFYDVKSGRILIDGQDISSVTQASLRASIGIVPQDTVLFNDTILYNIRYGRVGATAEEVFEAARLAQIHEFVVSLPGGYDSLVGERGLKLSGGEKQRVAIARTILKNPPILILDEATSALDSFTEQEIQTALDRIARDRTTLVIAHRLSTVVHADMILCMDKGEIIERGTHSELLARAGLYAGLWNRQQEAEEARRRLAQAVEDGIVRGGLLKAEAVAN
jgi:ATP-binding cassette subfamily B protein